MPVVSIPFTFSPGTTIVSAQVNANFTALVNAANNIVAANVGATGLYASNIIPTNTTQATFGGGNTPYTFGGAVLTNSGLGGAGQVPPFFTNAGGAPGNTFHGVFGTTVLSLSTGAPNATAAVALSSNAAFAGSTTYSVVVTSSTLSSATIPTSLGTTLAHPFAVPISGASFNVGVQTGNNANNTNASAISCTVNWIAVGT